MSIECVDQFKCPDWAVYPVRKFLPSDLIFIIRKDDTLVAYMVISYEHENNRFYIVSIEVRHENRRQGLATQLLNHLFSYFGDYEDYILDARRRKACQNLYKKFGFVLLFDIGRNIATCPELVKSKDPLRVYDSMPHLSEFGFSRNRVGLVWDEHTKTFLPPC